MALGVLEGSDRAAHQDANSVHNWVAAAVAAKEPILAEMRQTLVNLLELELLTARGTAQNPN
jgi:hypothetical protein